VYLRVAFRNEADGFDAGGEDPALRQVLRILGKHTATPATTYAGIWEGWTSRGPCPDAPRVEIPNRTMLLFVGPIGVMRDAPTLAWYGSVQGYQEPHLVWPEDHAWCLACEVDEEVEFSVGCSDDAARAVARALPGCVRRVRYGEPAPMYRDPS
jgi:hypothetical protein